MCMAVALSLRDLPTKYHQHPSILARLYNRGGDEEVQFHYNRKPFPPLLPIILHQQFRIVRWGNGQQRSRFLPATGWISDNELERGGWQNVELQEVVIVANAALDRGIWYSVLQGIEGLFVEDDLGTPTVYMRMTKPTDYYAIMTKAMLMPRLIGEVI